LKIWLGGIEGKGAQREHFFGLLCGARHTAFKIMVRNGPWKYIYLANGGREQLFSPGGGSGGVDESDLNTTRLGGSSASQKRHRPATARSCEPHWMGTVSAGFPFQARKLSRIYQFDGSRGITGFPKRAGGRTPAGLKALGG